MEKAYSSHPWIARYCVRTLQLLPALPTPVAIKWAVSGFPYCADTEPERAAEMFVGAKLAGERARNDGVLRRFFGETPVSDAQFGAAPRRVPERQPAASLARGA
ncbi:MAG TPA: hypothetical protein VNU71_13800 [Burkholderiaceae bacterium]|nr:hypothetical protein [Burkholderiaceae bacterium]